MEFRGKNVLVVGLGRSGMAAARALSRHGARVTLTDKRAPEDLGSFASEAKAAGFGLALGGHPLSLLENLGLIVLSPGVPGGIDLLLEARALGIEIIGEIELAFRLAPRRWLAVTGTNGKTTTTSLLAAMVEAAGRPMLLGGNIGRGLADEVEQLGPDGLVVAEISSFQLEEIRSFNPEVAVITNLTPDHLDRYKNLAAYAAAKARIFENQGAGQFLVLNAADEALLTLATPAKARKLLFSRTGPVALGAWLEKGSFRLRLEKGAAPMEIMPLERLRLRGPHNHENALAAALAAAAAGLPIEAIAQALAGFKGVEHRLEPCGEVGGIRFINDSKATNVDSVEKALQSFEEPVHIILGGRDKEGDFGLLAGLVKDKVARMYLIGEAADKVERQLGGLKPIERPASMEEAVRRAAANAKPGEWVLLSPGCASFDMFQNYEHRGRVFKQAVHDLAKAEGRV